mgnify:FL=1
MAADRLPQRVDVNAALFTVTVAARLADMHPQTLRGYDRLGLVVPRRAKGRGRRYSLRDIAKLRHIQSLSQDGINLEGVRRILQLEEQLEEALGQAAHLADLLTRLDRDAQQNRDRLFTAGTSGSVHLGRARRVQPPLALPAPEAISSS